MKSNEERLSVLETKMDSALDVLKGVHTMLHEMNEVCAARGVRVEGVEHHIDKCDLPKRVSELESSNRVYKKILTVVSSIVVAIGGKFGWELLNKVN